MIDLKRTRRRAVYGAMALLSLMVFAVTACGNGETTAASEPVDQEPTVPEHAIVVENAFMFNHVDGHGGETEMPAYVLFEYEQLNTVKYQVAYVACTCRAPNKNYWSVAYVELSKEDGSVAYISYDYDADGEYTPGLYGDSTNSWDGTPVREVFDGFIDETLMGGTQEAINAIEPMHGNVDVFTGATVTPNNAVRMLQGLFEYHNRRYS